MSDIYVCYKTVSKNKNSFVGEGVQMCYQPAYIMTIRDEYRDLWVKAAIDGDKDAIKQINNTEKFPYEEFKEVKDFIGFPCYMSSIKMDAGWVRTNVVKDAYMVKEGEEIPSKWNVETKKHPYYKEYKDLTPEPGDFFLETESGSQYTLYKERNWDEL